MSTFHPWCLHSRLALQKSPIRGGSNGGSPTSQSQVYWPFSGSPSSMHRPPLQVKASSHSITTSGGKGRAFSMAGPVLTVATVFPSIAHSATISTLCLPATVGVPEMIPVALSTRSPGGISVALYKTTDLSLSWTTLPSLTITCGVGGCHSNHMPRTAGATQMANSVSGRVFHGHSTEKAGCSQVCEKIWQSRWAAHGRVAWHVSPSLPSSWQVCVPATQYKS